MLISLQVWQMSTQGRIIGYKFSQAINDALMNGVKFLDNKGAKFAVTAYDSNHIHTFGM